VLRSTLQEIHAIEWDADYFPAEELKHRLREMSGFGTIYFTRRGRLHGSISLRNLSKEAAELPLQKVSRTVCGWNYKAAKDAFAADKGLDTIPVVDADGVLMGEYVRSSLPGHVAMYQDYLKWIRESEYKDRKFVTVLPKCEAKRKALECITTFFAKHSIPFSTCTWEEVGKVDRKCIALLADWVEGFCTGYVYQNPLVGVQIVSYRNLFGRLREVHRRHSFVDSLEGLKVYAFNFMYDQKDLVDTEYIKNYKKTMMERKRICATKVTGGLLVPSELKEKFFDELYTVEYWKSFTGKIARQNKVNGITWLENMHSKWVNIHNGFRQVLYFGGVHMFGRFGSLEAVYSSVPGLRTRIPWKAWCKRCCAMPMRPAECLTARPGRMRQAGFGRL